MELESLVVKTVAFDFDENIHLVGNQKYHTYFDIDISFSENLFNIEIDIQYFTENNSTVSLVSLRTLLELSINDTLKGTKKLSEVFLFALKNQFRYMSFTIWQRLEGKNVSSFEIKVPIDKELFNLLLAKKPDLTALSFGEDETYEYPF